MNDPFDGVPARDVNKWGRRATIAFCFLVLLAAAGFWRVGETATVRTEKGTYGNCHRTNIARAVDNENFYKDYLLFKTVFTLSTAPSSQQPQTETQKKESEVFLSTLKENFGSLKWIPLTNCIEAVNKPYTYEPPNPIEFSAEIPPTSAFELGENN